MSPTRTTSSKVILMTAVVLTLSFVSGCHKKSSGVDPNSLGPTTPTVAPPTASITADPLAIDLGQTVVLNWRTQNATSVTIDGVGQVNANGTQTVSPANSTNFHLTAKGDGGTAEANVRVTVRVPVAPTVPPPSGNLPGDMGSDEEFHKNVQDAFFDYDSYDLRPDAQAATAQAASYLAAHPAIRVVIGGYADERGSAEYNLALGENRANAARTALMAAGVAPNRLRVISYGKEKQFCTEQNETCWQENRRAQFSLDR
ncbi:OmpA family protein [Granulicella sp. dw_53]|uniref:OmpA family protein n=1 Tax=Granulicella sp. dw_53 TaxID=2719792 RepID=UPI001BD27E59|nr:OmpA family protein [Granulicella sp. dw_53]